MPFEAELEAAVEAAKLAAGKIRSKAGRLESNSVALKGKNDLVTEADLESQATIVEFLQSAFPHYGVMAEEDSERGDPGIDQWIIDPIDGTTNFVHGLPPFSVSIALQVGGEIVVGVVLEVGHAELFTAIRDEGCALDGRPCRVSSVDKPIEAMIATGFPTRDYTNPYLHAYLEVLGRMMTDCQSVRRMGSAAADLAYVACGRFDGFFEIGLAPWDTAAGSLLIREAGGVVSDFRLNGEFLHGTQLLASNGRIQEALSELVEPLSEKMK